MQNYKQHVVRTEYRSIWKVSPFQNRPFCIDLTFTSFFDSGTNSYWKTLQVVDHSSNYFGYTIQGHLNRVVRFVCYTFCKWNKISHISETHCLPQSSSNTSALIRYFWGNDLISLNFLGLDVFEGHCILFRCDLLPFSSEQSFSVTNTFLCVFIFSLFYHTPYIISKLDIPGRILSWQTTLYLV